MITLRKHYAMTFFLTIIFLFLNAFSNNEVNAMGVGGEELKPVFLRVLQNSEDSDKVRLAALDALQELEDTGEELESVLLDILAEADKQELNKLHFKVVEAAGLKLQDIAKEPDTAETLLHIAELYSQDLAESLSDALIEFRSISEEEEPNVVEGLHKSYEGSLGELKSMVERWPIPHPNDDLHIRSLRIIRNRLINDLLEPDIDQEAVVEIMDSLSEDGSWPYINYEDVSRTGFEHRQHHQNLLLMSRAYRKEDPKLHKDNDLKEQIFAALNFWLEHDFESDNWWHNQIGVPRAMAQIMLLMEDELGETQLTEGLRIARRGNVHAWGARPGGDRNLMASIQITWALLERNAEKFQEALKTMENDIRVSSGRGMQPDYSFQHRRDGVTSTLSYGRGAYISTFAETAARIANTRYAFSDETLELAIDYYIDGLSKSMVHAISRGPNQLNRCISRRQSPQFRPVSPETPKLLSKASDYRQSELEEIIAVRKGEKEPEFTFNKFFWSSEYHNHQRPEYFTSVRMYSERNHSVEAPHNEEGLRNHYMADGANFILQRGDEYHNIWPVYNWRKIPGTTVVQKPSMPASDRIQQRGLTSFAGGISDGMYGAAAFDFESPLDDLKAKKAWFFFDREYVCLGTGISSDEEYPVATTINQSLLRGEIKIRSKEQIFSPERGEHILDDTDWAWHDEVGYIFLSPKQVHMENDTAAGSWWNITRQSWARDTNVEKDVFKLWIDHGKQPEKTGYEYIVVPAIKQNQVDNYAESMEIEILSNTKNIQAVKHTGLNLVQIVFYEPGKIEIDEGTILESQTPALVMANISDGIVTKIAVADPTRRLDTMNIKVTGRAEMAGDRCNIEWNEDDEYSLISFDLPESGYAGKSVVCQ